MQSRITVHFRSLPAVELVVIANGRPYTVNDVTAVDSSTRGPSSAISGAGFSELQLEKK
jgi:hypothetical protein